MTSPRRTDEEAAAAPAPRGRHWSERLLEWWGNARLAVRRPAALANLPVRYRWEFTRRHPYYLAAWEDVRRFRRGELGPLGDHPVEHITQLTGQAALLAIGVSGEPVDPALEFDDPRFGGSDPFVISGACQPVSLRFLAELLLTALPPADRRAVGTVLFDAGGSDPLSPEDERKRERGTRLLRNLPSESLNTYPLMPFFYLHVDSSQRTVMDDVRDQVRLYQRGRKPQRGQRPELLARYLEVWDQREGWTGRGYSRRAMRRFDEIAGARAGRRKLSTAFDRYRRAFELVVGHPYTFDLWFGLFGVMTLSRYLWDPSDEELWAPGGGDRQRRHGVRRHRGRAARSPRARGSQPEGPSSRRGVPAIDGSGPELPGGYSAADLLTDIRDLVERRATDEEIAARLGLPSPNPALLELVGDLRRRMDEQRELSS